MAYKGFLISNYSTGFQTTKEPWISPEDAFVTLENARCIDGILSKRAGSAHLAQMNHGGAVQTTTITGLWTHSSKNQHFLLACDTARPNVYSPETTAMLDVSGGSDIFSGGAADLFNFMTLHGKTYMTNFQDTMYMFDGDAFEPSVPTAVSAMDLTTHATSGAKMNTAHMLFFLSDRFLAFDIVDDGTYRPYRLRYSQTLAWGETPSFQDGNYLDVQSDDKPVAGMRLGRYIYIWFEKSLHMLRPSGTTAIPFRFDYIRGDLGSQTPGVCIPFDKGMMTVGHKDLLYFDGYEVKRMNLPNLNNILAQFEWSALKYSWGVFDSTNRRVYITFAATGSTYPDRILEYGITDKVWAIHKFPAHALAMCNGAAMPQWDDADAAYASDGATLAEMPIAGGLDVISKEAWFPIYGGRDGWVWRMFTGTSDNDVKYDFKAASARLNPFNKIGKRCSLGRVAVLVDTSATASFDVKLYKNTSSTAYKTQTITCTGNSDKHWETLHAGGEIGDTHQIEFSNDAKANLPVIHATWLEMEPAGHINP